VKQKNIDINHTYKKGGCDNIIFEMGGKMACLVIK